MNNWFREGPTANVAPKAAGRSAFRLDGRMIDAPVVRRAREIEGPADRLS